MIGHDGAVAAVLDWELCTLGDPLADLGLLVVYWTEPDDTQAALLTAPTTAAGFPSRKEMIDRYAATSDRDLSRLDYYVAFGYWKLACILEGVYARYAAGVMGDSTGFESFDSQVSALARLAADTADRAGVA
jgi:aminoglycoside phosphotransferase (APT) family kinase protein